MRFVIAAYGGWPPADVERYVRSGVETLTEFSEEVVLYATGARTGVQAHNKYVPTVAHIRDACGAHFDTLLRAHEATTIPERLRDEEQQREAEAAERGKRLDKPELLSKYGFNGKWLPPMHDPERERLARAREQKDAQANRHWIEKEYALHGLKPVFWRGDPITLSMALSWQALGKVTIEKVSGAHCSEQEAGQ